MKLQTISPHDLTLSLVSMNHFLFICCLALAMYIEICWQSEAFSLTWNNQLGIIDKHHIHIISIIVTDYYIGYCLYFLHRFCWNFKKGWGETEKKWPTQWLWPSEVNPWWSEGSSRQNWKTGRSQWKARKLQETGCNHRSCVLCFIFDCFHNFCGVGIFKVDSTNDLIEIWVDFVLCV